MPLTDEELARRVAASHGGTWAAPNVEYIETRPTEVINETPGKDEWVAYIPRFTTPPLAVSSSEDIQPLDATADLVMFERRKWQTTVWVPEREEYDAEANVLRLYGYRRAHLFTVWVKAGSEEQEEEEEGDDAR